MTMFLGWKKSAGLICLCWGKWSLHLFVQRRHWIWGRKEDWYDGPICSCGLGPMFMVVSASLE